MVTRALNQVTRRITIPVYVTPEEREKRLLSQLSWFDKMLYRLMGFPAGC